MALQKKTNLPWPWKMVLCKYQEMFNIYFFLLKKIELLKHARKLKRNSSLQNCELKFGALQWKWEL